MPNHQDMKKRQPPQMSLKESEDVTDITVALTRALETVWDVKL